MRVRFAITAALLTISIAAAAPAGAAGKVYTAADVAKHASRVSCWTIVGTGVYDITTFITRHPGGQAAVLALCGKNGTAMFRNQHGGAGTPTAVLAGYRIGKLKASRSGSAGATATRPSAGSTGGSGVVDRGAAGDDADGEHDDAGRDDHRGGDD